MKLLVISLLLCTGGCATLFKSHQRPAKVAGISSVRGTWLQFGYHARKAGITMSRWEEASPKIKAKLKNKPGDEHLTTLLAGALYVERKYQQALYQASLVLKLNPNNRSARNIRGLCLLAQGKTEQANAELLRAFKASNHEIASGLNLGFTYLQQRNVEAAKDVFLQVRARCATCSDAALGLGIAYYLQKNYPAAIKA
ncbi:MAG: tetratricopeptide repeat protein, partial [Pseudomonadota bacterium]|nr:tetratricopeptide repeat protein [Pseudomonadota bacterium]